MIIKTYNENHPYLLFIDIEFSKDTLVQFAGLLFSRIENETYQLIRSCNQYVNVSVCYPFVEYTKITNNFLAENGLPLRDVKYQIQEQFLKDIPLDKVQIISHGLKNDKMVLLNNGINLSTYISSDGKEKPIDGYCTFNNAKRILKRGKNLSLGVIAEEAGYYSPQEHNGYGDVWTEVSVFTYLKGIEKRDKQKELDKNENS